MKHIAAVLAAYPGWRLSRHRRGHLLAGVLRIENRVGSDATFHMEIIVPHEFPAQDAHPKAVIKSHTLGRPLTTDAHVDVDGSMCVQMEERNEIDYQRVGLIGFMEQVELHLQRARIWALTTKFPGPQYSHGVRGRREYRAEVKELRAPFDAVASGLPEALRDLASPRIPLVGDRTWCPCGSGHRFVSCHKGAVISVRKEMLSLGPEPKGLIPAGNGALRRALRQLLRRRHR